MQSEYRAGEARIDSGYCEQVIGLLSKVRLEPAIWVAVVFVLTGCKSKAQLTPQEAEGKRLYDVRCAHCHEENDLGLKKAPPNLRDLYEHSALPSGGPASDLEVQKVVNEGKGLMPAFAGRFTDEQMSNLLSYLHKGIR